MTPDEFKDLTFEELNKIWENFDSEEDFVDWLKEEESE